MSTFLKLDDAATNKFVSCNNVISIIGALTGTGATAIAKVTIVYSTSTGSALTTTTVTYDQPGANNEYTGFTAATLQSQFEDAIMEMQNPEAIPGRGNFTGFKLLSNIVGVKVTASGVFKAFAEPTIATT